MRTPPPLNIQKTPDRVKIRRKSHGRTSGVGVREYWWYLFELNETRRRGQEMTDGEILRQMEEEFPHRPSATQRIREGKITVGFYRYLYNTGKLCKRGKLDWELPRLKSFRYDIHGRRINGRTEKVLPDSEQKRGPGPKKKVK